MRKWTVITILFIVFFFTYQSTIIAAENEKIYTEKRSPEYNDPKEWTTVISSEGGTRIVTEDGKEIMLMDNFGGSYVNGDLYLNNNKLNDIVDNVVSYDFLQTWLVIIIIVLGLVFITLLLLHLKLRNQFNRLSEKLFESK